LSCKASNHDIKTKQELKARASHNERHQRMDKDNLLAEHISSSEKLLMLAGFVAQLRYDPQPQNTKAQVCVTAPP
jgi:hypothetical protein